MKFELYFLDGRIRTIEHDTLADALRSPDGFELGVFHIQLYGNVYISAEKRRDGVTELRVLPVDTTPPKGILASRSQTAPTLSACIL